MNVSISGWRNGRKIAIAGIAVIAIGIFIENWDVARLSSLKASLAQLENNRKHQYTAEKPDYPVREADFLPIPTIPGFKATDSEKAAYEEAKRNYEKEKAELNKKFAEEVKAYNEAMAEFQKKNRELRKEKALSEGEYNKSKVEVRQDIEKKEVAINRMWFPLVLRFLGSLIFLLGAFFILSSGSEYEKAGVLILIGFAFKTLIGL